MPIGVRALHCAPHPALRVYQEDIVCFRTECLCFSSPESIQQTSVGVTACQWGLLPVLLQLFKESRGKHAAVPIETASCAAISPGSFGTLIFLFLKEQVPAQRVNV